MVSPVHPASAAKAARMLTIGDTVATAAPMPSAFSSDRRVMVEARAPSSQQAGSEAAIGSFISVIVHSLHCLVRGIENEGYELRQPPSDG